MSMKEKNLINVPFVKQDFIKALALENTFHLFINLKQIRNSNVFVVFCLLQRKVLQDILQLFMKEKSLINVPCVRPDLQIEVT